MYRNAYVLKYLQGYRTSTFSADWCDNEWRFNRLCVYSNFNRFRRWIFLSVLNTISRGLHGYLFLLIKSKFSGCLFFSQNAYIVTKYTPKCQSGDIKKKFPLSHVWILNSMGGYKILYSTGEIIHMYVIHVVLAQDNKILCLTWDLFFKYRRVCGTQTIKKKKQGMPRIMCGVISSTLCIQNWHAKYNVG